MSLPKTITTKNMATIKLAINLFLFGLNSTRINETIRVFRAQDF